MELILTRNELIPSLRNQHRDDIGLNHFKTEYYAVFRDSNKVSFRDDDGTIVILKSRY